MKHFLLNSASIVLLLCFVTNATSQTRDERVRHDRESLKDNDSWYYDDLKSGIASAKEQDKPLMIVLRCIP